jgi:hypothetical protein
MVAILALLVACAPTPASVAFDKADVTLNDTNPVDAPKATVNDANGAAIEGKAATCAVEGEAVKLEADKLTAVKSGTATVKCTVEGSEVFGTYTVNVALPAKIALTASAPNVAVGATVDVSAKVLSETDVEIAGQAVTWSTSDAAIATVEGGKVTGVAVGKATITATSGALTMGQELEVVAADAAATAAK